MLKDRVGFVVKECKRVAEDTGSGVSSSWVRVLKNCAKFLVLYTSLQFLAEPILS